MRTHPFSVAFLGKDHPRFTHLIPGLSPSFHPLRFQTWADLASDGHDREVDLVVLLPGASPTPSLPWAQPLCVLSEEDVHCPISNLEARFFLALGRRSSSRLLGTSVIMARYRGDLAALARSGLPLLLTGENGTGKDLAALEAHEHSSRADRPFVPVNCGAIPAGLAETEFFGSVRGAFTGAENRVGFCQQAQGGTLFLDEVGELPPEIQAKLLRALENQEVRRVGAGQVEKVDFRLICATNRDLGDAVRAGKFREDLYYRINVLPLKMPALRERKEDIPLLAQHFLREEAGGRPVRIGPRGLAKMLDYHWPGNLRQLRNVVLRAAVLQGRSELGPDDLVWDL